MRIWASKVERGKQLSNNERNRCIAGIWMWYYCLYSYWNNCLLTCFFYYLNDWKKLNPKILKKPTKNFNFGFLKKIEEIYLGKPNLKIIKSYKVYREMSKRRRIRRYTFKGKEEEEVLEMTQEDITPLFRARIRRKMRRWGNLKWESNTIPLIKQFSTKNSQSFLSPPDPPNPRLDHKASKDLTLNFWKELKLQSWTWNQVKNQPLLRPDSETALSCLKWSEELSVSTMERSTCQLKLSSIWLVNTWVNSLSLTSTPNIARLVREPPDLRSTSPKPNIALDNFKRCC